jgi:hypothetical protein
MVVAVTSNLRLDRLQVPETLMDFIIAAAQSSIPLPPNPDGLELLGNMIQQAAQDQTEPEQVPPLPEIAQIVSGQTYIFDPNPLAIQSVTLIFSDETEALLDLTINLEEAYAYQKSPHDMWSNMERQVGLDNTYRFSPGEYGIPMGMRGLWASDESFIISVDKIGNTGRERIRLRFIDEKVIFDIKSEFDPKTTRIIGWLEK